MELFKSLDNCFGKENYGGCDWKDLGPILNELLNNILLLGITIGVIMIMYAGFILVKSQGSDSARSKARSIFINIFIGLFLLLGSYYIVEFILDNFNVNNEYREDVLPRR